MKKIVILGAGPTGLGAAYRLSEMGYGNWAIYEKSDHVGGLSASFRDTYGFTWDVGGHILFSKDHRFNSLVDTLLGDQVRTHKRESWIWLRGHFIRYPFQSNFHLHPDKELVLECVLSLLGDAQRREVYRNFKEWIYHCFGSGIAEYFMIPYNEKVWACPLDSMDYNWIEDRVSLIDIKRILRNIVLTRDDSDWGPNNAFRYPLVGGIGGFFNRFLPYTGGHLYFNKTLTRIIADKKELIFQDDMRVSYDVLISTIPLSELIGKMEGRREDIVAAGGKLVSSGGYFVGIGVNRPCPSDKNWMYFPEEDTPFYRVTYLSNYSPALTPEGEYFSLLAETSYSQHKAVSKESIIDDTIGGLVRSRLLNEEDLSRIVSTYLIDASHSLPVPFLGRDGVLGELHSFLGKHDIYSRGRFGGWKYEVGNMDHSLLQGVEIVNRILLGEEETIYKA